jgi:hypothetical protein
MLYQGTDVNTQQRSKPYQISAPVGGLNGRDSLSSMRPEEAYEMTNMFPGTTSCYIRPGCVEHQAAGGSPVSSLEVFSSGNVQHILAFAGASVLDVTVSGTVTSLKSNLSSDEIVSTMFSTVADNAQFLVITTGADTPMQYNGTALTNLAITGLNEVDASLNYVRPYMGRLFFATENKLGFYYLPPGQIQGVAEWFDLGQLSNLGGYTQAIATYSADSGDGPNDYIVFISNRGEYIMFQGLDPGDATQWSVVGRYRGPEPIGRKCVLNYEGDLLVLTTEGVHQFSQIRKLGDTRFDATALTSRLGDILLKYNDNRDLWGWAMQLWPVGGMLIVNAPESNSRAGIYSQFVMNTITQAWCKFDSRDWDCNCLCMSGKSIYFGRFDGSIRRINGLYDMTNPISFSVRQSYNAFETNKYKHFNWAQFLVMSDAPVVLASSLSVDYRETKPTTTPSALNTGDGAVWDVDYWDDALWAVGPYIQRWIAAYGDYGVVASHWLVGDIGGATFEWFSTEHVFEEAEGLL